MFSKTVFVFGVLMLVMVGASPLQTKSSELSIIQLEEPCVRQGGMCLRIEDCNPSNLVKIRGSFCPMQQHLGVECCYG